MSQYFNLGKLAVEKGPKLVKTVVSPIKHAANVIRSKFTKPKTPKVGGQEKSKRIKDINQLGKKAEGIAKREEAKLALGKTDKNIPRSKLVETAKNLRDTKRIQREIKQFAKDTLKSSFKKGGPVDKKKKKKKFPDVSGDGKVTKKDILMARGVIPKPKNKKKVI